MCGILYGMYGLQLYPSRHENSYSTAAQIVNRLRQDSDTLLFYDAADPRYDGGQIPYDAAHRHFDGYLGSLWPANISPAGYEPTTDLSVTLVDGETDHLQSDLTTTPSGDFDVRLKCAAADWQSAGANYLVSQWTSTGSQRAVTLYRSGSSLAMLYSINGSGSEAALAVSATSGLTDGETYWLRWVFTSATATLEAFTSVDGVSWTSHGTDTNAAAHTLFDSSSGWEVCGLNGAQNITTDTTVYAVEVIDGSTTIIDLDFTRDAKAGETASVTDLLGNVWTFNGSLTVTDENGLTPNTKALRLPGTSGNYVSTPDTAALDITGDIDIRCRVALDDWTPAAAVALAGKWNTTTFERAYLLQMLSTGVLRLTWSTDGTFGTVVTVDSSVAVSVSDGEPIWVRATLDVSTGNVNFYTSSDGASWTQLGAADQGGAGATSIDSNTALFTIGARQNDGSADNISGLIYAVEVYDGIAGTIVLDVDFDRDAGLYDTSFTGNDGLTYTVNQSAATTNDPLVFGAGANVDYSFTGTKYVYLPGTSGNYLSTPDNAKYDITTAFEAVLRIGLDDDGATILSQYSALAGWEVYVGASGTIRFSWWDGAAQNNEDSNDTISYTLGDVFWLKVTFNPDDGGGNRVTEFYTADDQATEPTSWAQLGTSVTTAGTATVSASAAPVYLGRRGSGGQDYEGLLYACRVDVDSTTVIDLDVNRDTIAADHSTITDAQGNVWTVNRSAAPSFQATIIDRPLWLFGADTYIEVPNSSDWHIAAGAGFSAVAAYRAPANQTGFCRIMACRETGAGEGWFLAETDSTGSAGDVVAQIEDDGGTNDSTTSSPVNTTPGEVVVASIVVRSSEVAARANGTEGADANRNVDVSEPTDPLRIGSRSDNTANETTGPIHFAAVFGRALTEKELRALEIIYG